MAAPIPEEEELLQAIRTKSTGRAEELLKGGNLPEKTKETALTMATIHGARGIVEVLLKAGTKPDTERHAALHWAAYFNAISDGRGGIIELVMQACSTKSLKQAIKNHRADRVLPVEAIQRELKARLTREARALRTGNEEIEP